MRRFRVAPKRRGGPGGGRYKFHTVTTVADARLKIQLARREKTEAVLKQMTDTTDTKPSTRIRSWTQKDTKRYGLRRETRSRRTQSHETGGRQTRCQKIWRWKSKPGGSVTWPFLIFRFRTWSKSGGSVRKAPRHSKTLSYVASLPTSATFFKLFEYFLEFFLVLFKASFYRYTNASSYGPIRRSVIVYLSCFCH